MDIYSDNVYSLVDLTRFAVIFAIEGYLNVAARVLSQEGQDVGKLLAEISGWFEIFVSADAMHLALAAFSIYVPPNLRESADSRPFVEEMYDVVLAAFKNFRFEREDISKICLGMIGISAVRYASMEKIDELIDLLENSIVGYGGQVSFGAYYSLSMIAQALPQRDVKREAAAEVKARISRITGFLMQELLSCFEEKGDALVSLVAAIKSGTAADDLVAEVASLGSISLLVTKHVTARYLFISCTLCLPALKAVGDNLLLAVFHLLESFEWGSGSGIVVPPTLHACQSMGLLDPSRVDKLYLDYASEFERRMESDEADIDGDGLDDIFFVSSTLKKSTPHVIRRLLVGNRQLFDDDGCALSLIAIMNSIASLPCLGTGEFTLPSRLRPDVMLIDVESIVEIVSDAAKMNDDSKYANMGVVMLGLLASLRNPVYQGVAGTSEPENATKLPVEEPKQVSVSGLDPAKLPSPRADTLLHGVVESLMERCQVQLNDYDGDALLTRLLASLETLSLPGAFAKYFLGPMFRAPEPTPAAFTSLLCSQCTGRRRAVFDGRDFTKLAVQLTTVTEFHGMKGNHRSQVVLVRNLAGMVSKFPQDSVEVAVKNMWQSCLAGEPDPLDMILPFMLDMKEMIQSTTLSPKATHHVRDFVSQQLFDDIQRMPLDVLLVRRNSSDMSVLESFVDCLRELPVPTIEELLALNVNNLGFTGESFRVLIILELVRSDFFATTQRESLQTSKVSAWLATKLSLSKDKAVFQWLRRIACAYAEATVKDSTTLKRDKLLDILESLLLTTVDGCAMGLLWLGILLSSWCHGRGSDGDLSLGYLCASSNVSALHTLHDPALDIMFEVALRDLPFNLSSFCREQKISAATFNQLERLYKKWSEYGVGPKTMSTLEQTLLCCQSNPAQEEFLISLVSSILSPKIG